MLNEHITRDCLHYAIELAEKEFDARPEKVDLDSRIETHYAALCALLTIEDTPQTDTAPLATFRAWLQRRVAELENDCQSAGERRDADWLTRCENALQETKQILYVLDHPESMK